MDYIHSLLQRQIIRYFGSLDGVPEGCRVFLEAVDAAYGEFDEDRTMLEHSLDLSSQELLQANSQLRAIFQALPDLMFRLEQDGKIVDYKMGNGVDLYVSPKEFLGQRMQDVLPEVVGGRFEEAIRTVRSTESSMSIEYPLTMGAEEHIYEARIVPLLDRELIVLVRDITTRRRAEEELKVKLKELEMLNKVMMGREERILELKTEIKALRSQATTPSTGSAPQS